NCTSNLLRRYENSRRLLFARQLHCCVFPAELSLGIDVGVLPLEHQPLHPVGQRALALIPVPAVSSPTIASAASQRTARILAYRENPSLIATSTGATTTKSRATAVNAVSKAITVD